jgi:hypothetical protein
VTLCVVTFVPCWHDTEGRWFSTGGFPYQIAAIGSMFEGTDLVTVTREARDGGICLPPHLRVTPLREPKGVNFRRKLSVFVRLPYYLTRIGRSIRAADAVYIPVPGDLPLLGMILALLMRKRLLVRYGGSWQPNKTTTVMNRVTRLLMRLFAGGRNVIFTAGLGTSPPARSVK